MFWFHNLCTTTFGLVIMRKIDVLMSANHLRSTFEFYFDDCFCCLFLNVAQMMRAEVHPMIFRHGLVVRSKLLSRQCRQWYQLKVFYCLHTSGSVFGRAQNHNRSTERSASQTQIKSSLTLSLIVHTPKDNTTNRIEIVGLAHSCACIHAVCICAQTNEVCTSNNNKKKTKKKKWKPLSTRVIFAVRACPTSVSASFQLLSCILQPKHTHAHSAEKQHKNEIIQLLSKWRDNWLNDDDAQDYCTFMLCFSSERHTKISFNFS